MLSESLFTIPEQLTDTWVSEICVADSVTDMGLREPHSIGAKGMLCAYMVGVWAVEILESC